MARDLAQHLLEHEADTQRVQSRGANVLQRVLTLALPPQQIEIIKELSKDAQTLLHHKSGCFVVSQILNEAICSRNPEVGLEALNFMAAAHDAGRHNDYGQKLLTSMRHAHANHSVSMWVKLLGQMAYIGSPEVKQHTNDLWHAVDTIVSTKDPSGTCTQVLDLAQCSFGYRTLSELVDTFGKTPQMVGIFTQLIGTPAALLDLITHPYANFAIQRIMTVQPDPVIECILENFLHCVLNEYGNYVLQACLSSPACDERRPSFLTKFIEHKSQIFAECRSRCARIEQLLTKETTIAKVRCNTATQKQFQ